MPTSPKSKFCNCWFYYIRYAAHMMGMIPGQLKGKLASPSCLFIVPKPTVACGSLYFLCATSTTRKTARLVGPRTKPTPWMALHSSAVLPYPMLFSCTTPPQESYISPKHDVLTSQVNQRRGGLDHGSLSVVGNNFCYKLHQLFLPPMTANFG